MYSAFVVGFGVLLLVCQDIQAQDVLCNRGDNYVDVVLNAGDEFTYNTKNNKKNKYKKNQYCQASYELGESCSGASISCPTFALRGNRRCTRGDIMEIFGDSTDQSFCRDSGPMDYQPDGDFFILFTSNQRGSAEGFKCTVKCIDGGSGPTTQSTAAPTGNTGSTPTASTTASTATSPTTPTTVTTPTTPTTVTTPTTTTTGTTTPAASTTVPATTTAGPTNAPGTSTSYSQAWLRGPGDQIAHAHEGIQLEDGSGYVAVGHSMAENAGSSMVATRVDNAGAKVWTVTIGAKNSIGQSIIQYGDKLIIGGGLFDGTSMKATLFILRVSDGSTVTTTSASHSRHGSIRGLALKGQTVVGTGYVNNADPGFIFIADSDAATAMVWQFDTEGALLQTKTLNVNGMKQGAKIRVDPVNGGYVIGSSAWDASDDQQTVVVKLDDNLNTEWSEMYGLSTGLDQCFDILVDRDGNYLLGGHTTAGVINWDYLAIKVNSKTKQQEWRRTYGQPRGFDARYIHDEMYGVALDSAGNYLLLGGSGDEYSYSATNADGWSSDVWVSYLVVVSPSGDELTSGVYGSKAGNEAGEYLAYTAEGNIMVFTDSDTVPGMGFLLLNKN